MGKVKTAFVIGSFPGPINGVTVINQQLLDLLRTRGLSVSRINLSPGGNWASYHPVRMLRTLTGVLRILLSPSRARSHFIMSLDGGLGLVYNMALAAAIRARGRTLLLYHHSSDYVCSDSFLMRALLGLAGRGVGHIMCSEAMLSAFRKRYGILSAGFVVSNAVWVSMPNSGAVERDTVLRLGHLSGLNSEKGLGRVFETLREILERGHPAELFLAGVPQDQEARESLTEAQKEFGVAIHYAGVVTGDAKAAFYGNLDYFLFPSLYRHETQSLVVPEAMAARVPVVAHDHRFVGEVIGDAGLLIPADSQFASAAADWILSGNLAERRVAARAQVEKLRERAEGQLDLIADWANALRPPEACD
jgi:glycosyltransferase involved in cell wall biosynthesis